MKLKNQFFYLFSILLFIGMVSCGSNTAKWDETSDGVKIFHNSDQGLISKTSIEWRGDTTYFGLAHGKGEFVFTDEYNKNNNIRKIVVAQYGALESFPTGENYTIGDIDEDGRLNGFGVRHYNGETIIGDAKKGDFKGYGVILKDGILYYKGNLKKSKPDGQGISYFKNGNKEYSGKWKEGFFDGKGVLFYESGIKKYEGSFRDDVFNGKGILYNTEGKKIYDGKWKKGEYNGYGELFTSEGVIKHVWTNGGIDKTTQEYYNLIKANKNHFTPEQYNRIINRAVSWEKHHIWYYIILWICTLFICLFFVAMTEGTIEEDPFMKENKWKVLPAYLGWLLFGWIGLHRSMLRSRLAYIFIGCFIVIIGLETRDIIHFLFWPSMWFMWKASVITLCAIGIIAVMLVVDAFWIPWRVYLLNRKYYYADKYETEIRNNQLVPIEKTCRKLPVVLKESITELPQCLQSARSIKGQKYSGKTNIFAKGFRAIVRDTSAIDFESQKLNSLKNVRSKMENIYNGFATTASDLNSQLEQQRVAAKKNLDIARELLVTVMRYKTKGKKVSGDDHEVVKDLKLNDTQVSYDNIEVDLQLMEFGVDWDVTISSSVKNYRSLLLAGVGPLWSLGLGTGMALVGGIADAIQKEDKYRFHVANSAAALIDQIKEITDSLLSNEANILRANEILSALYKANKAFNQAYSPLRDKIYGEKISFINFIKGDRKIARYINENEFIKAIHHLKSVCQEYGKINNTKIN